MYKNEVDVREHLDTSLIPPHEDAPIGIIPPYDCLIPVQSSDSYPYKSYRRIVCIE